MIPPVCVQLADMNGLDTEPHGMGGGGGGGGGGRRRQMVEADLAEASRTAEVAEPLSKKSLQIQLPGLDMER